MGKKVKKTARRLQKEKCVVNSVSKNCNQSLETVNDGVSISKGSVSCSHHDDVVDLNTVSEKLRSSEPIKCEDCRENVYNKNEGRGKSKQANKKKKGTSGPVDSKSEERATWICLECGHFSCGGVGFPTTLNSHAVRHAKLRHHPLAIQLENPNLQWCFPCNMLIPVHNREMNGMQKDVFSELALIIRRRSGDVDNAWFEDGRIENAVKSDKVTSSGSYIVRGLSNLGNTCFFNSIMQNLLSLESLRDHFLKLDGFGGPLSASLKRLFIETGPEGKVRNVISPKSVFGCLCAMFPQFRGFDQHDSHELLRCLLDGLAAEELSLKKTQAEEDSSLTFVDSNFGGKISSTVCCLECGYCSTVIEPFLDLSLPAPIKKSSSKKPQPRKMKLPPKRKGKVRAKFNATNSLSNDTGLVNEESKQVSENGMNVIDVSVCDSSWLEELNSEPLYYNNNRCLSFQNDLFLVSQDFKNNDVVDNNFSSPGTLDSSIPVCTEQILNPESSSQNLCNDSEVLLLPYKEVTDLDLRREEVSSSAANLEHDLPEIDGIGGLFDDPFPPENSLSDSNNIQTNPVSGKESDSEPDDIEISDSPVSLESCLALFTKPEVLSNEHAWLCESCSKQQMESRKKVKIQCNDSANGDKVGFHNDKSLDLINDLSLNFDNVNSHGETSHSSDRHSTCSQASFSNPCNGVCDPHLSNATKSDGANLREGENENENEMDSEKVKVKRDASKRILISQTPQMLTIHLKRFCQDARGRLSKLNGHVYFGESIDLHPYMDLRQGSEESGDGYKYKLNGIVEHSGSMKGGHYVAYIRSCKQNGDPAWYHISDAFVNEVDLQAVLRCDAYILFYEKV